MTSPRTTFWSALALVTSSAVAASLLAACSGVHHAQESARSGAQFSSAGAAGTQLDPTARGAAPQVPGARPGGTVTVPLQSGLSNGLDPSRAYDDDSFSILNLVTRHLTGFQRRGDRFVLVPDMATDLGTQSDGGLTWTFHLKTGLSYADGSSVTASDVAYSIKRSFAPELAGGPTYQQQYFAGGGSYKGPYGASPDYAAVATPDANTLVIHLAKKFPDLPYFASFPLFTAVERAKDNAKNPTAYGAHPAATGPYQVSSFTPDHQLVLTRNPHWVAATDPIRNAYPDSFVFQLKQDPGAAEQRLIEDQGSDQTALIYGLDAAGYNTLQQTSGGPARLVTGSSPCTTYLSLDTRKITDVRIRKAVGLAYPYDAAMKIFGLVPGVTIDRDTTLLPPGLPGRVSFDPLGNGSMGNGNPAAAKALLRQAGAVGFTLKMPYASDVPALVEAAQVLQRAFTAAGFHFDRLPYPIDQVGNAVSDPRSPMNLRPGEWCSDWPSGSSWFPQKFYGPLIAENPQSTPNDTFLNEPDVNAAIDRIEGMSDLSAAATQWGHLDKLIMTKYYPCVILGHLTTAIVRGSKLAGVVADATLGTPFYPDIYVSN